MRRYALRDDQWERIENLLPGRPGHVGVTARDNRLFVEAVLYRYRAGIPWRDLPERFGAWKKAHTRFCRWARSGVWERVFEHLADAADNEYSPHSRGLRRMDTLHLPPASAGTPLLATASGFPLCPATT